MQKKSFRVEEENSGLRLDKYLSQKLRNFSRSHFKYLIREGKVRVNYLPQKPSYLLKERDLVEVVLEEREFKDISSIRLDIPIIYQDEDVIVINKPPGVIVHPVKRGQPSVVGDLLSRQIKLANISSRRPGVVHRLDKATSGLMVLAKNNLSYLDLVSQFKERKVVKEYFALVEGVFPEKEGKIDLPLKRAKYKPRMKVGFIEAKKSLTFYKVLKEKKNLSLLLLKPHTGRMHQLRVHLSFLGHPIIGDEKYGGRKEGLLFLHSCRLGFYHPQNKEFKEFTLPLPLEFKEYLEKG